MLADFSFFFSYVTIVVVVLMVVFLGVVLSNILAGDFKTREVNSAKPRNPSRGPHVGFGIRLLYSEFHTFLAFSLDGNGTDEAADWMEMSRNVSRN